MREKALAALNEHLARARVEPALILAPEAGAAAEALAGGTDPSTDPTVAHALGWYHWARWEALPEGRDADAAAAAVRYFTPVFHLSPESVPDAIKQVLGEDDPDDPVTLLRDYQTSGRRDVLDRAVAACRAAAAGRGNPNLGNELNNLVAALSMLFERTGRLDVLVEAAQVGRDAVAVTPPTHKRRARYLDNLGGVLRTLAAHTGQLDVLREATQASRDAVAASTEDHPLRGMFLSHCTGSLYVLYERTREPDLLPEAVRTGREAVAAMSPADPARAGALHNLGDALVLLYDRNGRSDVLLEAVQASRDAVATLPDGHPHRATMLNGLVGALGVLAERTGEIDVLREAMAAGREAVATTARDHPNHTMYHHNLGVVAQFRYERTGEPHALAQALDSFREASAGTTGTTITRIGAYRRVARLTDDPGEALRAIESAIDLVERLAPGSLFRADREHQLGRLSSLTGEAAAAALTAGKPERAVELLERARGILAADALELRSADHERLRERHPGLADQLDRVRARLDELDRAHTALAADPRELATARQDAHALWQRLVARVRELPGFTNFMRAPEIDGLARHAHDGPIVFVTTSPARGDALVLTDTPGRPVQVVPLPGLTQDVADAHVNRLLAACRAAGARDLAPPERTTARQEIRDILAWLWDTVVGPVLARLDAPRVWWCPVGVAAFLPLHAAGHHDEHPPRTALDRVVSSYTTTMRALAQARTRAAGAGGTVVVPVPDLPGAALPGVTEEATAISALVPAARVLANPVRDTVLAALPGHHVAHFACHGRADWSDPARSHLILADHATTPLTVNEISALKLSAGLAYLSACETSVTTRHLADESLHITGAFYLAGYRHVVGTLWPIDDRIAAEFATEFYRHLTGDGTTPPQTDRSAHALHEATRTVRARYPDLPAVWAAYTHTGA